MKGKQKQMGYHPFSNAVYNLIKILYRKLRWRKTEARPFAFTDSSLVHIGKTFPLWVEMLEKAVPYRVGCQAVQA